MPDYVRCQVLSCAERSLERWQYFGTGGVFRDGGGGMLLVCNRGEQAQERLFVFGGKTVQQGDDMGVLAGGFIVF